MTTLRDALVDCLSCEEGAFERRLAELAERHDIEPVDPDGEPPLPDGESLTDVERRMVGRIRRVGDVGLGLTLTGPAYQDNPLVYANDRFRELTGYSLSELRGRNLRLLQGPDTETDAVADLREGLDIWERATVELWNYRTDGSRFRNRVSVVPIDGDDGSITNWLGVQERIDG